MYLCLLNLNLYLIYSPGYISNFHSKADAKPGAQTK